MINFKRFKKCFFYRLNEKTITTEVDDTETTTSGLMEDLEVDGELERMANSTMESNNTRAGNNTFVAAVEEAVEDVMEAAKGAADHVKNMINKHILGEDSEEKEEKVESEEEEIEEKAEEEDEDESEKKVVGNKRNSRAESEDPKFVLRETNQKKVHKVVKAGEENLSDDHEEDEPAEDESDDDNEDSDDSSESNTTTVEADATTEDAEFRDVTTEEPTTESDDVIATGGFVAENTDAVKEDNKSKLPSTQAESKKKN